ncbi:unnamed protein product [Brassica rapa]|uniref:Uncharacterized protein n=2 Tax=Brassica TaxID=3705 RepID=A0A8D9LMT2_BRACM|nr:unnamed protein product [Brassica napus]CAG7880285.1 unnamed protein product [Brassica rapa]
MYSLVFNLYVKLLYRNYVLFIIILEIILAQNTTIM